MPNWDAYTKFFGKSMCYFKTGKTAYMRSDWESGDGLFKIPHVLLERRRNVLWRNAAGNMKVDSKAMKMKTSKEDTRHDAKAWCKGWCKGASSQDISRIRDMEMSKKRAQTSHCLFDACLMDSSYNLCKSAERSTQNTLTYTYWICRTGTHFAAAAFEGCQLSLRQGINWTGSLHEKSLSCFFFFRFLGRESVSPLLLPRHSRVKHTRFYEEG